MKSGRRGARMGGRVPKPLALVVSLLAIAAGPQPGTVKSPAPKSPVETSNRHYVTVRGEIVDYYCYIEKGLTGPMHKACGTRCVMGDICMGILTTDGALYMISVNHLRAMDPTMFRGITDPWFQCRDWIAEKVDLSGYAMERKGQKIIEIMAVKKASGPPPDQVLPGAPPARSP